MAKGRKTGGRQKGTPNRATAARRAALAALNESHTDPISFFCSVLRDENAPRAERRDAAHKLLPYYHPKLATIGPLLLEFLKEGAVS